MKKAPLYSRSRVPARGVEAAPDPVGLQRPRRPVRIPVPGGFASLVRRVRRLCAGACSNDGFGLALNASPKPAAPPLTMAQIDTAMRDSIAEKPLPSPVAAAYDAILPSVVRVIGLMTEGDDGADVTQYGLSRSSRASAPAW